LSGLARLFIPLFAIGISILILVNTQGYLHLSEPSGFLRLVPSENLTIVRWTIAFHALFAFLLISINSFLLFGRIEMKFPKTHRFLGKSSFLMTLTIFIPTGYILSIFNTSGNIASVLFLVLTSLSLIAVINGWKRIKMKDILSHQKYMERFYILLTSAIWLRINMFITTNITELNQANYVLCVILSWIPQLFLYEILRGKFKV
jgi:uncharacterized membrane protein